MSALQIITSAWRKKGVTSPTTVELAAGLEDLQNMLSSWSADGLSIPSYVSENFTLTIGQAVYTIGDAGGEDLSTVRPVSINNAFIRISNYDHPVKSMSNQKYNRIRSKDSEGRPLKLYYDPQYPSGKIRFDKEPDVAYDFHLVSEKPLTNPTSTATTFSIPLEYNLPMIYNLTVLLTSDSGNKLGPEVFAIAEQSLDTLRTRNAVDKSGDEVSLDVPGSRYGYSMDFNSGE
jgi:hypothetical protein